MVDYVAKTPWNDLDKNIKLFLLPYSSIIFNKCKRQLKANAGAACVILYHSAIEAVFNDIIGFYECIHKYKPQNRENPNNISYLFLKKDSAEFAVMENIKKIERKNLYFKINELMKIRSIYLKPDEKFTINDIENQRWYKEMSVLLKTRNALVHPKATYQTLNKTTKKISGLNKFMNEHVNKKRIEEIEFGDCWIDKLDTSDFCLWCEKTAYEAMEGIKNLLVKSDLNDYLLSFLKLSR